MKLQKLLFFTHADFLIRTGRPLIKQEFEAWDYGPVIPSLYREFKKFKDQPITSKAKCFDPVGRQAFCQGDWIEAGLKLIDLSGGDAVEARMFDESDIGAASDALLARYVKTYVEAKRAADRKRADQPKDKAVSLPMDELFERKR
jgi:uncharacterized phage-associated protein